MLTVDIISKLLSAKRILVAFSGGLDSTVLLHSLISEPQLQDKKIIALHVNHNISVYSAEWVRHCQEVAKKFKIKLLTTSVTLDLNAGHSLENIAREARYGFFASIIQAGDVLVTGHHQNDQAETLLLQLFRGAGVRGMAAMPMMKKFAGGSLLRPFLHYNRKSLENYAETQKLNWIDDESNLDISYDRNFIRHEVLPLIQRSWPTIVNNLARSAEHHADAEKILVVQAAQDLVLVQKKTDQIDIPLLKTLSVARQKNLLRYWITRHQYLLPSEAVLQQVIEQAIFAAHDASPCITWDMVEVRRYNNTLYIMPTLLPINSRQIVDWNNQYLIPNLELENLVGKLTLRFRQGGERFHPENRQKSQTLKKLLQEWQVPPWLRDRIPLLYLDEKLIAVVGYAVAKNLK